MLSSGLTGDPEGPRAGRELRHGLPLSVNFAWTTVGHLVYAACQWGQLSILAKLGSPEMLGEFVLALAVTSPVMMLSSLELRSIQVTDADREYSFGHYLGLRLATATLGLLSIVGFTAVMGYVRETALVIVAIGLAKAIGSVSEAYHGLLQLHERMDRVAKSLMINGPLSLAALATDVFLTGSVLWGALGMAAAAAAVLLAYDVRSGRAVLRAVHQMGSADNDGAKTAELTRPRWEVRTLASLAWLALPLGLVRMLMSLNTSIPRYAIERYVGRSQLGVFAAMAYFKVAGDLVVTALGRSATPQLARDYAEREASPFLRLLAKLVASGMLLGVVGVAATIVAGRTILSFLYQPEYASQLDVFVWLMSAAGINYVVSFLGYGMTAARQFKVQLPLMAIAAGSTALICLWLVPVLGLQGAALALVVSTGMRAAGSIVVVAHALRLLSLYTAPSEV